jgi:hypothetical protein
MNFFIIFISIEALADIGGTLECPLCSPDMASCDFLEFPRLKHGLRGH